MTMMMMTHIGVRLHKFERDCQRRPKGHHVVCNPPLHDLLRRGDVELFTYILTEAFEQFQFFILQVDPDGRNIVHVAIQTNRHDALKCILDNIVSPDIASRLLNQRSTQFSTPLLLALRQCLVPAPHTRLQTSAIFTTLYLDNRVDKSCLSDELSYFLKT